MKVRFACLAWLCAAQGARIGPVHEFQQNGWFQRFGEHHAQFLNPAATAGADMMELSAGLFGSAVRMADRDFFAFVLPFGGAHAFGLTFFDNNRSPEVRTTGSPCLENAYQFGWSMSLQGRPPVPGRLSAGVNYTLFQLSPVQDNRYLISGMDLGVTWASAGVPGFGRLQLGASLQNALRPGIEFSTDDISTYRLPGHLNGSLFWQKGRFNLGADVSAINLLHADGARCLPGLRMGFYPGEDAGLNLRFNRQGYVVLGCVVRFRGERVFRRLQLEADLSHDALAFTTDNNNIAFGLRMVSGFGGPGSP